MLLYIALSSLCLLSADALKVLFIQTAFTKSHILFSNSLTALLARRGHVVDQIVLDFNPPAFDGDNSSRHIYRIRPEKTNNFLQNYANSDPLKHSRGELSDQEYVEFKCSFCAALLDNKDLIDKLRAEKYDLGVNTLVAACGFGFFHLLGIQAWVGYSPMQNYAGLPYLFGIPQPYVTSPEIFDLTFPIYPTFDHSSIFQRTLNFLNRLRLDFFVTPHMWIDEDQLFQDRFENFPPLADLYAQTSYVFLGTDPLLDRPRPISSKIKYVGGVHRTERKQLPEEYEKLLNGKQAVLFSLGAFSNTSNFRQEIRHSIARAFARFPNYIFFWKYSDLSEDADFFANITNIYRSTWLPQHELLHDPRLKLAISHTGQNSYYEIMEAGKPMITIPLFVDQYYNAACALRIKVAYHIDKAQLNEETMFHALKTVLEEPSYAQNAGNIGQALRSNPRNGSQEFIVWSEHAAKFPQLSRMQTLETSQMSVVKYLSLDVVLFLTAIFTFLIFFVTKIVRILKYFCVEKSEEIKKIQ